MNSSSAELVLVVVSAQPLSPGLFSSSAIRPGSALQHFAGPDLHRDQPL